MAAALIIISGCSKAVPFVRSPEPLPIGKNLVVDSGQDSTYNSNGITKESAPDGPLFGQDADYRGTPFAFMVSADKTTVRDLNTGITWERTPSSGQRSWQGAVNYCERLQFSGHDDWRLPSLKELLSIEDFSDGWPYLNTDIFSFGRAAITKDLQYWSNNFYKVGTTHNGAPSAFGLNYATGHIKAYPSSGGGGMGGPNSGKRVRCVYGHPYGENQFTDNGDGTISDRATGLMWMKVDSGKGLEWRDALSYAENLEFAGHDDWKLPNVKELQSIVDYSGVYPAINQAFFDISDKDSYFWTSTSAYFSKSAGKERFNKHWAWYVAFGYAIGPDGTDMHGAGAVRFDTKKVDGPMGEDAERVFNYARAVREID
jgi:hypothetical protein